MKNVVIGIVSRHFQKSDIRPNTYIRDEIKDAIYYNGAIPIGITSPTTEITVVSDKNGEKIAKNIDKYISHKQRNLIISQLKMCKGVILQGGVVADAYEIFIANYCYVNDIPILGICEGQSNLVWGQGGSTVLVSDLDKHEQKTAHYVHNIIIKKGTLLYKILKKTKIKVNSRHHYTIKDPKGLIECAYDDDGNIEAVEAKNKKFFLGVRFHPESLYKIDKNHNKIFKYFIKICKNIR